MAVVLNNHVIEVRHALQASINRALESVGLYVVGKAKETVHVVSGNLKDSIDYEIIEPNIVRIGTNVEYAVVEEFRAGEKPGFGKHSFLRPAAEDNIEEITRIVESIVAEDMR